MSDHMTAREAWEIVKQGEPTVVVHFMRDGIYESTEDAYKATQARYARACAIVEARIDAGEAELAYADACKLVMHGGASYQDEKIVALCSESTLRNNYARWLTGWQPAEGWSDRELAQFRALERGEQEKEGGA